MVGARRQVELSHRRPHQTLTLILQLTKLPYLPDAHVGVGDDIRALGVESFESGLLNISGGLYTLANRFTCFTCLIST